MTMKTQDRRLSLRNSNIRTKLILMAIAVLMMTIIPMIAMQVVSIGWFNQLAETQTNNLINQDLDHLAQSVYDLVASQDQTIQQKIGYDLDVAQNALQEAGGLRQCEGTVNWSAIDQSTREAVDVTLPQMCIGDTVLVKNEKFTIETPIIDKVTDMVGGTMTIFQRMNDAGDMLRIATNVPMSEEERAVGTYISAVNPDGTANPVVSAVMNGETYRGTAYVWDSWYITAYEPVYGDNGEIIGALYVGVDPAVFGDLNQSIKNIRIGDTGYAYVLGGQGENRGRYIVSEKGLRDGENIWDSQDADGHFYVQEIIEKGVALAPGEMTTVRYPWQNPGDPAPRMKSARVAYYEPWDWVIGISTYDDDYAEFYTNLANARTGALTIVSVIGLAIAGIAVVLSRLIARSIATPVERVAQVVGAVGKGDLTQRVEITTEDEIGILGRTFNEMVDRLQVTIGSLESRTQDLGATIEVGSLATRIRSQEALLPQLVEFIRSRFDLYFTQIYLLDEAKRYAVLRAGTGTVGKELLAKNHRLDMAETSIVARTVREGEPVLVSNTESSTIHKPNPLLPDTRSEVAIPLVVGGEILGVLDMQAVKADTFNEDNLTVFRGMANQIASALQGAQAYDEAQAAVARAEAINQRLVSEAWQPYLGKIGRGEKTGYQYELEAPKRLEEDLPHADKQITREDLLIQPLAVSGQSIGSIVVKDDRTHTWTKEEQALIEDVSDRLALALDRFRSFDETELARQEVTKRASEMETVARVGAAATTTLDMNELLQSVVDLTKERFNLYHAHIYLLDENRDNLVLAAGAGEAGKMMVAGGHSIPLNRQGSMVATAARSREGVISNNVRQAPNFLPNPLLPRTKSEMAIPMIVGDDIIGVLDIQADVINRFTNQDLQVQSTLAGQIATAVQNARLFEQQRKSEARLSEATNAARIAYWDFDYQANIFTVSDEWYALLGTTAAEQGGNELTAEELAGKFMHPVDVEKVGPYIQAAYETEDPDYSIEDEFRYFLPNGETVIHLARFRAVKDETGQTIGLSGANQDITERKRQEAEIQRRAADMETVAQVGAAATTTLDVSELLQSVVNLTKERFNLYHAHVYLLDESGDRLVLAAGAGAAGKMMVEGGHSIPVNRESSVVAMAARTREGVIVNNVSQTPNFLPNPLLPETKSEMAIPLIVGDAVIGVLDVQARTKDRFDDQDVQIQSTLAGQIATAVQNARSFEQAEAARQEVERIFSTSIDMIGSSNFEGYFVSLNPAWEETTGYTIKELMSEPFVSFVHPDDVEATVAETAKMAEGALVLAFENRYRCKDGTYKWISWRAIPDFEADLIHFVARDVTESKQAEAEIRRRASEMETVAQVSTSATTTLDMDELLQSVADLTKERFNLYHAHIYLLDEARENLVLAAGAGEAGRQMVAGGHSIALNRQGSIVATAARTREGVITNDVTQAPNFMANPLLPNTKSEMAVPMVVGNTVVGVLDVQADVINRFTNQDVQIQSTLAAQVAAAVQNARSFEQTQFALAQTEMQAQRLAQLNEMGEMLNRAVTLDDILRIAAEKTPQIVEADRASIAFVNSENNTFEVLALAGEGGAIPMGSGMPLTGTAILVATEERQAIMVNDAANSEYGDVRNIAKQGINTTMSAPLIASGYAIGTINLGSAKHKAYTQSDMNILLQVAALLASAIENRRLFDQIEASLAQTEALYTGSDRVVRATSMQDVLMAVVESTEIQKLDRANIMLFNEPWDDEPRMDTFATVFAVWEHDGGESRAPVGTDYTISQFPILTLLRPNEPLVINDAEDDERVDENFRDLLINRLQMRSVVFLPLVAGGEWIGVLTAQSTQATPFSDSAVRQMDSLADQAANVIQTLRLIEQQQETVERLQEVDRLKQQFLANMSHELRTPLNSIIGYSEVLLDGVDGDLTEDAEEDVEAIHDSGKHLLSIINEILDLAKIEAGQMQLDPQEIELPQFVKDIVHSGQILVKDKDVALEWVEESEVPTIQADPIRVRQVLWNLISNAVKFTEAGSVTVTYGMHSDREVFVKVEDTGIGMTKEGVGSIFERFSQVDGSSTRRAGGTGLGLTITRQLVRMHGGEVYVESEVGVGSTFLFTLPIKVTEKA